MTVVDVKALGDEIGHMHLGVSAEIGTYTKMAKIELICTDECVKRIKNAILKTAKTGYKGDGIVTISSVKEAVSIRTGKKAIRG